MGCLLTKLSGRCDLILTGGWLTLGGHSPSGSFSLRFCPGLQTLESAEALRVETSGWLQPWGGGWRGWWRWWWGRRRGCWRKHVSWRGGRRVRTVQAGHLHGEEVLGRGLPLLLPLLGRLAPGTTTNITAGSLDQHLSGLPCNVQCALTTMVHSPWCIIVSALYCE